MSFSINNVLLLGNLVKPVDFKTASNGIEVANIILATNRNLLKNGRKEDVGTTHKIVAWDRLALFAYETLHVGDRVCIEGRLDTREITDEIGVKRFIMEVVAKNIIPMTKDQTR